MLWRFVGLATALALVLPTITNAAVTETADQTAIQAAKNYIEDGLKDPFSAKYRHLEVRSLSGSPHRYKNVCGYVYAKDGNGTYGGGAQFVVGLRDDHPIGLLTDIDNNQEAAATLRKFGTKFCDTPFTELQADLEEKKAAERAADAIAAEEAQRCEETFKSATALASSDPQAQLEAVKRELDCFTSSTQRHRQAYSRIMGFEWQGAVGVH